MREFLLRGTQAEKKGAEDSYLPINIIEDNMIFAKWRVLIDLGAVLNSYSCIEKFFSTRFFNLVK
jgi:hypothetical protein